MFHVAQPAYERLRVIHSERRRPIVFWVGAGLSQPAGLPGWVGLRDRLINRALETAATLPNIEGAEREAVLERASSATSLWESFQIIKDEIGAIEFREEVRSILDISAVGAAPSAYGSIWALPGVRGVLTLNIDQFSAHAHRRERPNEHVVEFVGRDVADYAHILGAGRPFIANLHGIMDSQKSWIFTKDEILTLAQSPGYISFI